jgi:23S rRNA pseudouridine1911/1915/1917 synthase
VLAKTSKCAARLSEQFRERACKKIYLAVVAGSPKQAEAELCHRLEKDPKTRITRAVAEPRGKEARLRYRVLRVDSGRALLEVMLITGLSHQIRAQLSAEGHPIIGDKKYGSTVALEPGRIALFAKSILFQHPISNTSIFQEADPPSGLKLLFNCPDFV